MAESTLGGNKQRATREGEKQQRRQDILDTAWKLFQETSYPAITMAEVAEKAGLAKGTVYLYFKTKEELFLAVQQQQLENWFDEIDARLNEAQEQLSGKQIAAIIAGSLETRAAFTRLLAILHTVLEQNIEFDTALQFKQFLLKRLTSTGQRLEKVLPFLQAGQGLQVILQIYAFVIGLQHLADPSPVIRRALQEPGMQVMQIEFQREFPHTIEALLSGLEQIAQKNI